MDSAQLLVQFKTDILKTLQTLSPCFEDMHVVGIYTLQIIFCHFLRNLNFSIFRNYHILKVKYQLEAKCFINTFSILYRF